MLPLPILLVCKRIGKGIIVCWENRLTIPNLAVDPTRMVFFYGSDTPRKLLRFYAQTGQIEWLLAPNRRFAAALADKGYPYSYEELPSGHNWATWEQGLEPGLKYLFGLPD